MKTLIFALTLMISVSAFACGETFEGLEGKTDISIDQTGNVVNGTDVNGSN